jgi:membrane-bound lytic murein transglycosylase D
MRQCSAARADLSFIESVLAKNSLPTTLAAIVTVESAGDPMALSPKGARGLWQLMPDTARRYGLRVDNRVDERVDPLKSTGAAARYLRDLYEMFNDWPLVLAAYNAGESRILKLIERMTRMHRFAEMADRGLLPAETILYVPAVLSLMYPEKN